MYFKYQFVLELYIFSGTNAITVDLLVLLAV
jgi:hypothetical protein